MLIYLAQHLLRAEDQLGMTWMLRPAETVTQNQRWEADQRTVLGKDHHGSRVQVSRMSLAELKTTNSQSVNQSISKSINQLINQL